MSPFFTESLLIRHDDAVSVQECLYPVVASCFFLHKGMSYLEKASEALDLLLRYVGTGECPKSEHLGESLGIQFVVLGDELAKLNGVCNLDVITVSEKILVEGVVAGAGFQSYHGGSKIWFQS